MNKKEIITFGAGCFWCVEVVFQELKGVEKVVSGYSNGKIEKPTYKQVCTGETGCVEVCQVTYNPDVISFENLLEVFWSVHDPTTLNQQGADIGTQYRSGIYYSTDSQKVIATEWLKNLNTKKVFPKPIVTEITKLEDFSVAEDYHQNYYNLNKEQGYCKMVIKPKLDKFRKAYKEKITY
jgi:peptide-methionine (S)-S-oxide reductase